LLFIEKYFRYKGANTAQSLKLEAEMLIVGQALHYGRNEQIRHPRERGDPATRSRKPPNSTGFPLSRE
jgi:hypothetical protein